jgi:hypothetical protein
MNKLLMKAEEVKNQQIKTNQQIKNEFVQEEAKKLEVLENFLSEEDN